MTVSLLLHFQRHINDLTALKRNHYLPGLDTKEDDTSHSYSVAILAWQLNEITGAGLQNEKLLKYALVHDFVEIYAGDVNAFAAPELRKQKDIDEQIALEKLRAEYTDAPDFIASIEAYQTRRDEEAEFVWACDKMQALLQDQLNSWRCHYEVGVSNTEFIAKLQEYKPHIHPALRATYKEVCTSCIASYDSPEPRSEAA